MRMAFLEDKGVLEQVHLGIKHAKTPYIDLGLDKGAKLFRKALDSAIEAETTSMGTTARAYRPFPYTVSPDEGQGADVLTNRRQSAAVQNPAATSLPFLNSSVSGANA